MTTLARHGVAFRFNFLSGLPYYDDDEEIVGYYGAEPMWQEADLSPEQEAELQGWIAEHLAARPQDDPLFVRWATLERNGVEHFHRRGRPLIEHRPAYGYECAMCKAYVVAKDPGDVLFHGGPVDGRWFVIPSDRQTWIVPVPQPISIAPHPAERGWLTGATVTYERGRDGAFYHRG